MKGEAAAGDARFKQNEMGRCEFPQNLAETAGGKVLAGGTKQKREKEQWNSTSSQLSNVKCDESTETSNN